MFGIGGFELFLILLFGFLIFGPDKLPQIAKTVGQAIAKFKNAQQEMSDVIKNEVYDPSADDPFKNPLDALAKLDEKAKKPASDGESFSERKARYEKERAERKNEETAGGSATAAAAGASTKKRTQDESDSDVKVDAAASSKDKKAASAKAEQADNESSSKSSASAANAKSDAEADIDIDDLYAVKPKAKKPAQKKTAQKTAVAEQPATPKEKKAVSADDRNEQKGE